MDELVKEALEEYKREYEEYLDFMLAEYDVPKNVKLLQDNMLLHLALKEATETIKDLNMKNRSGWYRNNDGQSDHNKRKNEAEK
ncbi:MAG: hypothetical protein LUI12_10120 [Clostridiales bacterium]|nr:hypothetical protein [Clostridiales bacterium]